MLWSSHQHSQDSRTSSICDARQGHSSEAQTCGYRLCNRDCYQKAPGICHRFCGRMHADAHMSEACDYVMLQQPGLCRLQGCYSPSAVDEATQRVHDFCTKQHMLDFTTLMTALNLRRGRLCQIEKCFRPVYVDENGKSHSYCGLKHSRLAAAAKGAEVNVLRNRQPEESGEEINSNSNQDQDSRRTSISPENQVGEKALPPRDMFGHTGFEGAIPDQQLIDYLRSSQTKLLEELAQGKQSDSSPNKIDIFQGADGADFQRINIFQGADISKSHPWEVVTESKPRYLLTIASSNKVPRQTKDGWCWKQTSRPYVRSSALSVKYFNYKQTKEKCVDSSIKRKKGSWTLHEHSLIDDAIEELAGEIGLNKSDRFRKAVILKMYLSDSSGPGREDHPTSNLDSAIPLHELSGGEVSDPNGQRQSPPAFDSNFCCDSYGHRDAQLLHEQLMSVDSWCDYAPSWTWVSSDCHHL